MVALDFDLSNFVVRLRHGWPRTCAFMLGAALLSAMIGLTAYLVYGGDESGWPAAALCASRFSSLVFLIFLIAGPVSRLFPARTTKILGRTHENLVAAFLVAYAASLIFMIAPLSPSDMRGDPTIIVSSLFAVLIGTVLALSASRNVKRLLGGPAQDAMQWVATSCFWLIFASDDLRHIYGPHRPDDYYGLSLLLLVGALLLRFADAFKRRIWLPSTPIV